MATATKIDLTRGLKGLYKPSAKKPAIVEVPEMNFLMLDGSGDPNDNQFQEACNALYGMSYTLKFMLTKQGRTDYRVMPLEGLWWMAGTRNFDMDKRQDWKWRAMIAQPDLITADDVFKLTGKHHEIYIWVIRGVRLRRSSRLSSGSR